MILQIVAYGAPILRRPCRPADITSPALPALIKNMQETMENAHGLGLAAPQVNVDARIFITREEVFINPHITWRSEETVSDEEGCLSIPDIQEAVIRPKAITITWLNESLEEKTATFEEDMARIIQHEYDHIEGKLYTDLISPFRRKMLTARLERIQRGKVPVPYPMRFFR